MLLVWIIGGVFSLAIFFLLISLWISVQFVIGQEVVGLTFLLLLVLDYSLSRFRLPTIEAIFDVHAGYFMLEKKWLWIRRTVKHPISEIRDIHVIRKGRFGKAKLYYRIEVELISGEMVSLSAANYRPEEHVRRRAKELGEFLGTVNLSRTLQTGRKKTIQTVVNKIVI